MAELASSKSRSYRGNMKLTLPLPTRRILNLSRFVLVPYAKTIYYKSLLREIVAHSILFVYKFV